MLRWESCYGWQWVTGKPWSYSNWSVDEPNGAYGPASELDLSLGFYGPFGNDSPGDFLLPYTVESGPVTPPGVPERGVTLFFLLANLSALGLLRRRTGG